AVQGRTPAPCGGRGRACVPCWSRRAVWGCRGVAMLPAAGEAPLAGSYSSADVSGEPLLPPATSTVPLVSSVAVAFSRALAIEPVSRQGAGSYSAAEARAPELSSPPATSRLPVLSKEAVATNLALGRDPAADQPFVAGL